MDSIQDRLWKLEDRYGLDCANCPDVVKDEYRELQREYDFLEKKVGGDQ